MEFLRKKFNWLSVCSIIIKDLRIVYKKHILSVFLDYSQKDSPAFARFFDLGKQKNQKILEKAIECLNNNILVGAICGATLALVDYGVLDRFKHTSNSREYLNFFSKRYAGNDLYVCSNSVLDKNLVTASSASLLEWTKNILKSLNVYPNKKLLLFAIIIQLEMLNTMMNF